MTRIEWNDGLSLGVEEIDKQHMHLIDLANKLLSAAHRKSSSEITKTFHELREYTVYHFNDEEHYMERIHYPKFAEHVKQHSDLKNQVKNYQDTIYRHGVVPEEEIIEFLKNWLIGHIIQCDLAIKEFLTTQRG